MFRPSNQKYIREINQQLQLSGRNAHWDKHNIKGSIKERDPKGKGS